VLKRDPHAGDLFVFRGKRGNLLKVLWHDGYGMSLYAKRLENGKFVWPTTIGDPVTITGANGYSVSGQAILDYPGTYNPYPQEHQLVSNRDALAYQGDYKVTPHFAALIGQRHRAVGALQREIAAFGRFVLL